MSETYQQFEDCRYDRTPGSLKAILISDYGHATVHRAVDYLESARELAPTFGLFGFWRVKVAK